MESLTEGELQGKRAISLKEEIVVPGYQSKNNDENWAEINVSFHIPCSQLKTCLHHVVKTCNSKTSKQALEGQLLRENTARS